MIEYKIGEGDGYVRSRGTNEEIAAEICYLIEQIYKSIRNANEDAGRQFRSMILMGIMTGLPFKERELTGEGHTIVIQRKRGGAEDE